MNAGADGWSMCCEMVEKYVDVLIVCKLQLSITDTQLRSLAGIAGNISSFIRSYFVISWMSRTAAIPATSVTLSVHFDFYSVC